MSIRACREPATVVVFLDGDGPGTPMCGKHGNAYIGDTDYKWSALRPSDHDADCGFILAVEE